MNLLSFPKPQSERASQFPPSDLFVPLLATLLPNSETLTEMTSNSGDGNYLNQREYHQPHNPSASDSFHYDEQYAAAPVTRSLTHSSVSGSNLSPENTFHGEPHVQMVMDYDSRMKYYPPDPVYPDPPAVDHPPHFYHSHGPEELAPPVAYLPQSDLGQPTEISSPVQTASHPRLQRHSISHPVQREYPQHHDHMEPVIKPGPAGNYRPPHGFVDHHQLLAQPSAPLELSAFAGDNPEVQHYPDMTTMVNSNAAISAPLVETTFVDLKVCSVCGKRITRDMIRHMRTHQSTKRFNCKFAKSDCTHKSGQFNRRYDFKKHLLNKHFHFDDAAIKRSHNLRDKLNSWGTCPCSRRFISGQWLEEHIFTKNPSEQCPHWTYSSTDNLPDA